MAVTYTTADSKGVERVFGLIAGAPGIGKTTLMTQFPVADTLGVNVEDGLLSIKGSGVRIADVENYQDLVTVLQSMNDTKNFGWVKYLFIDSLAEIYEMLKRETKGKYTQAQNFQRSDDIRDQMLYLVRLARQLTHMNVFFTSHTKLQKVGMGTIEDLSFDGKMPEDLRKQFDLVLHMTKMTDDQGVEHRVFLTNQSHSPMAKVRASPFLGITVAPVEEPNLFKLTQKLLGKKE